MLKKILSMLIVLEAITPALTISLDNYFFR